MQKPILFEKPRGVRDVLPPLAARKREVEKQIAKVFTRWGFEEITTPTFEYAETFLNGAYRDDEDQMFKFIERSGKTVVLRPDMTAPIARVVSSLLKEHPLPIRLSYNASIFRQQENNAGRDAEFTQSGVELIGDETPDADAEVMALACHALTAAGVNGYRIAIGQVAYLKGLFEEHIADESVRSRLSVALSQKDFVSYERIVNAEIAEETSRTVLLTVVRLRGGVEVLKQARTLTQNQAALAALDNLETIWKVLVLHNVEHYLQLDLGLLLGQHYYSGAVFEGYAPNVGFPVCSGGRYDELLGKFGRPAAATGFMIGVERVLEVLEKELPGKTKEHFLVFYDEADRYPTIGFTVFLRSKGFIVTAQRCDDPLEKAAEARAPYFMPIVFQNGKLLTRDKLVQAMFTDFSHMFSI
ncbi:ATP phosphoribosyltransferase regulatory subunit [Tumebacillus flagellatus]|uniref:ATP phosphoribosyltransferase regulatory subunit n=1 Tax=Tumebacillus flagellatus TaxID=1157490 RepID=A0A074LGH7_9BACL|nr:ATP phosphoribosyltransferase regulatory subunit [Tumebacillus flagellatus]KEO81341.1 histidyl-tRNA synthetase 2 [Tumebacillus flagellatus]